MHLREPAIPLHRPATPRPPRGVTLIELMIGLAVLAIMMMSGAPAFTDWIRNVRIRTAAESILNGIQVARTEAVRRNNVTRFQLVSTLDAKCEISDTGRHWVVNLDLDRATSPEGKCDKGEVKDIDVNNPAPAGAPYILQKDTASGSAGITIQAERSAFSFNGLGQQTAIDGDAPVPLVLINIESNQAACVKADGSGGPVRCLRIEVSRDGQARLCDPGLRTDVAANRGMGCES